jgi:hypothetical protein
MLFLIIISSISLLTAIGFWSGFLRFATEKELREDWDDHVRLYKNGLNTYILEEFVYGSMSEGWSERGRFRTLKQGLKAKKELIKQRYLRKLEYTQVKYY